MFKIKMNARFCKYPLALAFYLFVGIYSVKAAILVRSEPTNPDKTLQLDYMTFRLNEDRKPATVEIKLGANGQHAEYSVEASLLSVTALKVADESLCLLTFAAGCDKPGKRSLEESLAIHPAIAHHQLALVAAVLAESLRALESAQGTTYILAESEWSVGVNAFNNKDGLYTVYERRGGERIHNPELTKKWRDQLNPDQLAALATFNDFLAVYRLINAAASGYIDGFPEEEFVSLLQKTQPYYEKQAVTPEQERLFHEWVRGLDQMASNMCGKMLGFLKRT